MKKSKIFRVLPIAAGTAIFFTLFNYLQTTAQTSSVHLRMGNPSNAGSSYSNRLLSKSQYAVSYNCYRGTPNWVSWQLNRSWLGSAPRQDDFRPDTTLPSGCYRVTSSDYTGSGFDRGHTAPSADRTNTVTNNSATFLMTNMIPQAPDNNQGVWASLESYCRDLVNNQNKELYIISGSYGTGGTGSNGFKTTIAGGKVTVPTRTWKVIVVLNSSNSSASSVTTNTRVIAVNIPNTQGIRNANWKNYRVSVDSIEANTGYNLLSNVSTSVQSTIEARVDTL
ncbi:DNA/RNA non-specific endonuclease [Halotia branconii]|uniref:DNA/RNA non-specific endonuclease n=1 Tax=Halotia branconii CENA392 TaxID=1539056 RepID=A0AAJ6NNI6_9CYAN|nr:DNA/RNA non-specific endonuclease [Halotia branconii]WGV23663.1 DNA/RNA non-specific endonuclease [Halotia branconii CENA392]